MTRSAARPPLRWRGRLPVATLRTYAALVAALVAIKLLFLLVPRTFPLADQLSAFSWPVILGISALGLLGLHAAPAVGIADAWDPAITNRQRFAIPIIEGVGYGVLTVLLDLGAPGDVHMAVPWSIPFYTFGAILLETLLRIGGLTIIAWVVWRVLFLGRWRTAAFWIANVATALYEPLPGMLAAIAAAPRLAVPGIVAGLAFRPLFLANLLTGELYRRYGLVSAVVLRLAFYAVWHIAYGGFRPFWLSL